LKQKLESETELKSPKCRRRSEVVNFSFLLHCIFCGQKCDTEKCLKNPSRWRKAYVCRTGDDVDFKDAILRTCAKRNDKHAEDVRLRVEGSIIDLHAAEARYHVDCRASCSKSHQTSQHIR